VFKPPIPEGGKKRREREENHSKNKNVKKL
jgi:hypothetical protein